MKIRFYDKKTKLDAILSDECTEFVVSANGQVTELAVFIASHYNFIERDDVEIEIIPAECEVDDVKREGDKDLKNIDKINHKSSDIGVLEVLDSPNDWEVVCWLGPDRTDCKICGSDLVGVDAVRVRLFYKNNRVNAHKSKKRS